jgi:hypothetical protein
MLLPEGLVDDDMYTGRFQQVGGLAGLLEHGLEKIVRSPGRQGNLFWG